MSDLDRGHPPARVVARPTLREHHVLIRGMRQAAARRQLERGRTEGDHRARLERRAAGPVINDPADPRLLCTHDGFVYGFRTVSPSPRFATRSNSRQRRSPRSRSHRARRRTARRGSDPGPGDPEPAAPERRADVGARR